MKGYDYMSQKVLRSQSLGEEIANAVSHGVGALLAIAGAVVAIVMAAIHSTAIGVVSAALYGSSLILLYSFSTLYHSLTNKSAKKVFRIFDHCAIFILILGSYIPICLTMIGGALGWTLFGINAEQDFRLKEDMPMENMVRLYDVFEEAIEYSLDTLSELYLSVIKKENGVAMMLWLCTEMELSSLSMEGLTVHDEG
ncbi:MAG: hemolysin III family protein, partial [Clostridia bacterium]|nr:hemolysin III family protein [Clostridia bacterium]